ncbi:MAG: VanW family protein [Clostridia bacterium]|nr:VanW family protein [Clostridia bacterium]
MVTAFNFNVINALASNVVLTVHAFDKTYKIYSYETSIYNGKRVLNNAIEKVEEIYYDTLIKYKNAEITFNPNQSEKFKIKKGRNGKQIDKNALLVDISNALNNNLNEVTAKQVIIEREVTEKYLSSLTNLRARFTTYYNPVEERAKNIALASSYLSGATVNENEEFSFNKAVGERTEERGFLKAKIILDGEFIEGVGGGVCQVSTTTYNALLLSGLKITEQHAHSLPVSYVEPSFDAMVSFGFSDLKFYNDTGGKIFIGVSTSENSVTVSIYGKKMDRYYERVSKTIEETPPLEREVIYSSDLKPNETKVLQYAKNGVKSEGYLIEYSLNGERLKTKLIRKDSYKSVREKVLVGK